MRATIFDCDPGIDDSFALFLISKMNIKIDYFVATFGNSSQKNTKRNLEIMTEYLSLDGEIVSGCECSLNGLFPEGGDFHGKDGLADIAFEMEKKFQPKRRAVIDYKALSEKLSECDEIVYYAVGPLTTLASIIDYRSELKNKIKNVFVMGGGLKIFNKEFDTEYNFYSDGLSVKKVFESGMKITIFPLDLTMISGLKKSDIDEIEKSGQYPEMITMLKYNFDKNCSFGSDSAILHDTLPVLYSAFPDKFKIEETELFADENGHIERLQNSNRINVATAMEKDLLARCLKKFFQNGDNYE